MLLSQYGTCKCYIRLVFFRQFPGIASFAYQATWSLVFMITATLQSPNAKLKVIIMERSNPDVTNCPIQLCIVYNH